MKNGAICAIYIVKLVSIRENTDFSIINDIKYSEIIKRLLHHASVNCSRLIIFLQ